MKKIENKNKLKELLVNKFWTVKQYHTIVNSDKHKRSDVAFYYDDYVST